MEGGPGEGGREGAEHDRVAGLEGQVSSPLSWLAPDSERELLSECRTTSSIGEKGAIPANQCQAWGHPLTPRTILLLTLYLPQESTFI